MVLLPRALRQKAGPHRAPVMLLLFALTVPLFFALAAPGHAAASTIPPTPKLRAADVQAAARYGGSVAADGDILVVGSPAESAGARKSGSVAVYQRNRGGAEQWGLLKQLTPAHPRELGGFGTAVALSGDVLVVGAPGDDDRGMDAGAVYVYERHAGGPDAWGLTTKLVGSRSNTADNFGRAVAVSGDAIAVGAPGDDTGRVGGGCVYLFTRYAGFEQSWGEVQQLLPDPDSVSDQRDGFGEALAMDGPTLAVGAPHFDIDGQLSRGAVSLYERHRRAPNRWMRTVVRMLSKVPGTAANDTFGWSLALEGDTLVAGAPGFGEPGAAFRFSRNFTGADQWGQSGTLLGNGSHAGDRFGHAVALDGAATLVSAYLHDDAVRGLSNSGAVYIYMRGRELARIQASDRGAGDEFGFAAALSNGLVVVGAQRHDAGGSDAGAAYLFSLASASWREEARVASGDDPTNRFGAAVALDSHTLVAAAPDEDSGTAHIFARSAATRTRWERVRQVAVERPPTAVAVDDDTLAVSGGAGITIFRRNAGGAVGWGRVATIDPITIGGSGPYTIALAGDTLAVGVPSGSLPGAPDGSGFVRTFERTVGGLDGWGRTDTLALSDAGISPAGAAGFGFSVALDEQTLAATAFGAERALVFGRAADGLAWDFQRRVAAGVEPAGFGWAVALEGDLVAVSTRVGVPLGASGGEVRIFGRHQGGAAQWGELVRLPQPPGGKGFGFALKLDGGHLLISAAHESSAEEFTGAVYLHALNAGGAGRWGLVSVLAQFAREIPFDIGASVAIDLHGDSALIGSLPENELTIFEHVLRAPVGLALTVGSAVMEPETPVQITARLELNASGPGTPPATGTVRLFREGVLLSEAALGADGIASFTLPGLPQGVHELTARFDGGMSWGSCVSPPLTLFVGVEPPQPAPAPADLYLPLLR